MVMSDTSEAQDSIADESVEQLNTGDAVSAHLVQQGRMAGEYQS